MTIKAKFHFECLKPDPHSGTQVPCGHDPTFRKVLRLARFIHYPLVTSSSPAQRPKPRISLRSVIAIRFPETHEVDMWQVYICLYTRL